MGLFLVQITNYNGCGSGSSISLSNVPSNQDYLVAVTGAASAPAVHDPVLMGADLDRILL